MPPANRLSPLTLCGLLTLAVSCSWTAHDATTTSQPSYVVMPSATIRPTDTSAPTVPPTVEPTVTLALYPYGGWTVYTSDTFGFSFEYPARNVEGICGRIYIEEQFGQTHFLTEGGTTGVLVIYPWEGDLNDYVAEQIASEMSYDEPPLVEETTVDRAPALRVTQTFSGPGALQYRIDVFTAFGGRLYWLHYAMSNWVYCDAPPISEEAVFNHILTSWRFYQH